MVEGRLYLSIRDGLVLCLAEENSHQVIDALLALDEFGLALDIAKEYSLDADPILKAQWIRHVALNPSTLDVSILKDIRDTKWCLEVCLTHLPNNANAIRSLLSYGLSVTDRTTIKQVEYEIECVVEEIDLPPAPVSALDYCLYRVKLLKTLDRLSTFESVFGEHLLKAGRNANVSSLFRRFLDTPLLDFAAEQARKAALSSLELLFTRHGKELLPHRLFLLSKLPLTLDPQTYFHLLPTLNGVGQISTWREIPWRRKDWSETPNLLEFLAMLDDRLSSERFSPEPYPESIDVVLSWYQTRIAQIESTTGQVGYAVQLARFAVEAGFSKLTALLSQLQVLRQITERDEMKYCTLDALAALPALTVVEHLVSQLNAGTVESILDRLYAFVAAAEKPHDYESHLLSILTAKVIGDPALLPTLVRILCSKPHLDQVVPLEPLLQNCASAADSDTIDLTIWHLVVEEFQAKPKPADSTPTATEPNDWDLELDDLEIDVQMEQVTPKAADTPVPPFLMQIKAQIEMSAFLQLLGYSYTLQQVRNIAVEPIPVSRLLRKSNLSSPAVSDSHWTRVLDGFLDFGARGLLGKYSAEQIYGDVFEFALSEASAFGGSAHCRIFICAVPRVLPEPKAVAERRAAGKSRLGCIARLF
ncbi:hypothetical protein HDU91_007102 [Kappamyces sp. JEL0680]|nr:hypothetical protein HDU91_007102 [Kappamyces sp. JEL0680]